MKQKSILALCAASANRQSAFLFATAVAGLLSGPNAQGAVKIWVGNTDATFGTAANWNASGTPLTGDSFTFNAAGSSGTTLTSALTSFSAAGFTFNSTASAYTIGGTAMTLTGNIANNSTVLQTINLNLATTAVRTITTTAGGGNITLGGTVSGALGGIIKNGVGTLSLNGATSYTGATTVNAGIFQMGAATGTLGGSITVNSNGTFISDNTTNNNPSRIGDAVPVNLNGGSFLFKGNAAAASADNMGIFTLTGPSLISISTTSVVGRAQIAANSLNYTAGTGATLVNGVKLGSQIASTAGITQFTITNAPTLVGGTAGLATGINSGVYNTNIVPFLLGEATTTTGGLGTASGNANTFVTYSATGGLRPLNLTDEFDASTTFVAGNNVRVTGATSVASNVAINSMILCGANVSIADGINLTNTSGALMFSSTNSIAPTGTTGALAFGSAAAQITVLPTFTGTISSTISGIGGLVKIGTGNLILSGAGSYTGSTSVNGGTVSFTGALVTDSASGLAVNNPNRGAGNDVILNLSTTAPSTVGSLSGTISTPSSGTNTSKINNGGQLLTISQTTAGSYDGVIEGAGGLTKTGSSVLSLSGIQTYAGPTIISAGTLDFNRAGASGTNTIAVGSSVTVASGATLAIRALGTSGITSSISAPIALTGNGTTNSLEFPQGNNQTIEIKGGISVTGGAIIRAFGLINNYNYTTVGITGDATTSGLIFRMEGGNQSGNTHNVNFNVASTYTGNTTFTTTGGTTGQRTNFRLGVNNALPTTTSLSLIGGTHNAFNLTNFDLNGKNQTLAGLTTTPNLGGASVTNSSATASTLTIDSTTNQTVAGILGGAAANNFALIKSGTGILSLSGTNTYTGATTVNSGGALSLLNSLAKSSGSAFTVNSGATLGLGVSAASNPYTSANVDSLFAGALTGVTNHANSNVGIDTTGGNFTYATSVVSTTRGLNKLGANTLILTGANNYTGETLITTGTLQIGAGSTTGTLGSGNVTNNTTLAFNRSDAITVANNISGAGAVTQTGAGTTELTGTTTYTGATTVDSGKLVINGNISTSSLTTVNTGGTLGGAGTVGALTVAGGTVGPGNSPGVLNVAGNYSQTTGNLAVELNGTTVGSLYDQLNVTGTVTLGGALAGTVGYTPVNGNLLFILANDGADAISGTFSGLADLSTVTFSGFDWQITYFANSTGNSFSGGNDVALMAIPEPDVAALLGGLGMIALLRRRRSA